MMIGREYTNNEGYTGIVIDSITPSDPRSTKKYTTVVNILFDSGYAGWYDIRNVRKGHFRNYGIPNSVGGYAYQRGKDNPENVKIFNLWNHMMHRCYNKSDRNYPNYGARGVEVCSRWHYLEHFEEDIKKLENYEEYIKTTGVYSLDKDSVKQGNLVYSPETCVFADRYVQAQHTRVVKRVEATKNGNSYKFPSIAQAAEQLGLHRANISKVLKGELNKTGGYYFKQLD